jgi:hypothetical protein
MPQQVCSSLSGSEAQHIDERTLERLGISNVTQGQAVSLYRCRHCLLNVRFTETANWGFSGCYMPHAEDDSIISHHR